MAVVAQKGGVVHTFTCRQWFAMDNGGGWAIITIDCTGDDAENERTPFAPATGATGSGVPAAGDKNFVFIQPSPSATWAVTHNLGKYPSVTVVDSSQRVVVGKVEYLDINSVVLTFSGGFSGKAYFN